MFNQYAMYQSPFAIALPEMEAINGVDVFTAQTGEKFKERDDLLVITFPEGTEIAGVFTKNKCCGEPIKWGKEIIGNNDIRALVVNAGNANVFTGNDGYNYILETAKEAAEMFDIRPKQVMISSTGVIGEVPNIELMKNGLFSLKKADYHDAAVAFMTTDTFPKAATRTAFIGSEQVTLHGISKGSGMIEPNMATMLSYIVTDANIPAEILQPLLKECVDKTYNCITVDSDTSTSDTVLTFATCEKDNWKPDSLDAEYLHDFKEKLLSICEELALLVVKDGEGITKLIKINVTAAETIEDAQLIGKSIANSPLVKTAIFAEDLNWGRLVMAVGKAGGIGATVNPDIIDISIGGFLIAENGARNPEYVESNVTDYMKGDTIEIDINLKLGEANTTIYSSDLTHEYIKINAEYRS